MMEATLIAVAVRFWNAGEIAPTCWGCKMTAHVIYRTRTGSLCSSCAASDERSAREAEALHYAAVRS